MVRFLPTTILSSQLGTANLFLYIGGGGAGFLLLIMLVRWAWKAGRRRIRKVAPAPSNNSLANTVSTIGTAADDESMGSVPDVRRIKRGERFRPKSKALA